MCVPGQKTTIKAFSDFDNGNAETKDLKSAQVVDGPNAMKFFRSLVTGKEVVITHVLHPESDFPLVLAKTQTVEGQSGEGLVDSKDRLLVTEGSYYFPGPDGTEIEYTAYVPLMPPKVQKPK